MDVSALDQVHVVPNMAPTELARDLVPEGVRRGHSQVARSSGGSGTHDQRHVSAMGSSS